MPYSRSLAGVGGRLEGASEWRDGWGDMVEGVGRAAMLFSLTKVKEGDLLYASGVFGEERELAG